MEHLIVSYKTDQCDCKGYLAFDPRNKEKRPGVLVAHAWQGQDDFARKKAFELAELGYVAFAVDMFGDGKFATTDEEASALITPFLEDRVLMQTRIVAAYNVLKEHALVDASKIGAIGFCFGGLTVLELARAGVDICAVVTFHGVFSDKGAKLGKREIKENTGVLILNGYEDPLVAQEDLADLQKELTTAKADWEVVNYGHTSHAFTNQKANGSTKGLIFNSKSAKRSWLAMKNFFRELLESKEKE